MKQTKLWKVGDLAHLTGLTVRTLHHWDELGLVSPRRTAADHRCYSSGDVARLYQVMALKQIGLGLDQIAALFAGEAPQPSTTLRQHLDVVEAELRQRREFRDRLVRTLDALDREDADIDVQLLLKVIEKMTMFENQLTAEQRGWFAQRREEIGEGRWQAALDEWPHLIAQVRAQMDAGAEPSVPQVRQFIRRWDELAELFIGDQPEMRIAAGQTWQHMWATHPDELRKSPRVAPPEMWDYIQRARESDANQDSLKFREHQTEAGLQNPGATRRKFPVHAAQRCVPLEAHPPCRAGAAGQHRAHPDPVPVAASVVVNHVERGSAPYTAGMSLHLTARTREPKMVTPWRVENATAQLKTLSGQPTPGAR